MNLKMYEQIVIMLMRQEENLQNILQAKELEIKTLKDEVEVFKKKAEENKKVTKLPEIKKAISVQA